MTDERFRPDPQTAAALIAAQFPDYAHLPVLPVDWQGWDNTTYRLGESAKLRLPTAKSYEAAVEKEVAMLAHLAGRLPVAVPVPIGLGQPGPLFPYAFSLWSWLDGAPMRDRSEVDFIALASDLAGFLAALGAADPGPTPPAGAQNFHRGGDLVVYEAETLATIAALGSRIDGDACRAIWQAARASRWEQPPVIVHGDVAVGNLLLRDGRLSAVIDFGSAGIGDPASDLVIAWTLFDAASRAAFRADLAYDDATWARARGWALWKALITLQGNGVPHPCETPPAEVIAALVAEARGGA